MTPRVRRLLIPLLVFGIATGILLAIILAPNRPAAPPIQSKGQTAATATSEANPSTSPEAETPKSVNETDQATSTSDQSESTQPAPEVGDPVELTGLHAVAPDGGFDDNRIPSPLGSNDWRTYRLHLDMADNSGGIKRITLTDIWKTSEVKRKVLLIQNRIIAGEKTVADLPLNDRYQLAVTHELTAIDRKTDLTKVFKIPVLAANAVVVDGQIVTVFGNVWSEIEPGLFVTEIRNEAGESILRISRQFIVKPDSYDITLQQRIVSLLTNNQTLKVEWWQYGPGGLRQDRARYFDRRRFRFGRIELNLHPNRDYVTTDDELMLEHPSVLKSADKAYKAGLAGDQVKLKTLLTFWPTKKTQEKAYELAWFAATNRYFTLAVHPVGDENGAATKSLASNIDRIEYQASSIDDRDKDRSIFTTLYSPERVLAAGAETAFDLSIYAGPLDRHILDKKEPYISLAMGGIILYQMSSCCGFCTFQGLAKVLLFFLTFVGEHLDWGIAIILLVLVVRTLLHPITKRAQIGMQRTSRAMAKLKPEIDKIQKKYANDANKQRQEQMRLMREHKVNMLGCLGFVPMLLQTPIWIALYAMLYFAYDLRQTPAFWGVFQSITGGHWSFLADLSAADHFFWEFAEPFQYVLPLLGMPLNFTGINFLPILMGIVFFIQQKYMTPPPSATMSKEQIQQQKIMKVMIVVMMPIFLYNAPSGLTLYILTSSFFGIIESRYIRRHIDEIDLEKPKKKKEPQKKSRDPQARAYMQAMERMKDKRKPKAKTFKKRD